MPFPVLFVPALALRSAEKSHEWIVDFCQFTICLQSVVCVCVCVCVCMCVCVFPPLFAECVWCMCQSVAVCVFVKMHDVVNHAQSSLMKIVPHNFRGFVC